MQRRNAFAVFLAFLGTSLIFPHQGNAEVGGTISGVAPINRIFCYNQSASMVNRIPNPAGTEWLCDSASWSAQPGDNLGIQIAALATGQTSQSQEISGDLSGIDELDWVVCLNRRLYRSSSGLVILGSITSNSWNCSKAGLQAEVGDKIDIYIAGKAAPYTPATPKEVSATAGHEAVTLQWQATARANSYQVFVAEQAGLDPATALRYDTSDTKLTITGLLNDTSYYFIVVAINEFGSGTPSVEVSATPQRFDHTPVLGQACISCHDNVAASGKNASHPNTTNSCESCHDPFAYGWLPVNVDHSQVLGICASCHAFPTAHFETSAVCDSCHLTQSWFPVFTVDHSQVVGTCATCHSLPAGHIDTTNVCDACHASYTWVPVNWVDHSQVLGNCSSCHTLPGGHCLTLDECNLCHSVSSWLNPTMDCSVLPPTPTPPPTPGPSPSPTPTPAPAPRPAPAPVPGGSPGPAPGMGGPGGGMGGMGGMPPPPPAPAPPPAPPPPPAPVPPPPPPAPAPGMGGPGGGMGGMPPPPAPLPPPSPAPAPSGGGTGGGVPPAPAPGSGGGSGL